MTRLSSAILVKQYIGYEDRRAVVPVAFGEPGDAPVLGVVALEALGYQLDPATKRLETPGLLMI